MKKIFLTSGLMMCVVMPAMAVPTNTSNTFPNDELMQADYTYTNQATYNNMGVYSDSVDAEANYDWDLVTVNAGYYLPANSTTPVQCTYGNYCPGLAQQVHMDSTAQGLTACPTGFKSSALGATTDTQCYRGCNTANMGTTITNYPHAFEFYPNSNDYYGGTENDTCLIESCEAGYHVDNNACVANTITINWNGATAAAISANNAGTTTYGGDIRTPQSIDPSQVPAGKRFVGWKFSKPSEFNLATLDTSLDDGGWGCITHDGNNTNQSTYDLTNAGTWGLTFSYGKVRGEALCSSTSGTYAQTGTPDESETGPHCWCKATQYQANGSSEWKNVSPVPWVLNFDGYDAADCAFVCAVLCAGNVGGDLDVREAVFGVAGN